MKKLLITLIASGLISFLFGNYIFKTYKSNLEDAIKSVSSIYEKVYMLQYGSYKDKSKATSNNLSNYILEVEEGFYKVYVGITLSEENAKKIKEIYKNLGNDIYIKEKYISNIELYQTLSTYEEKMSLGTKDEILDIQNKIITSYKEVMENE